MSSQFIVMSVVFRYHYVESLGICQYIVNAGAYMFSRNIGSLYKQFNSNYEEMNT